MRNHRESNFGRKVASSIFTFVICFVMIAGQTSAQVRNGNPKDGTHQAEWTSTWTGPFTCEAVNASTAVDVAHITTDNELRLNYTPPYASDSFTYTAASGSKPRVLVGTSDTGNTMTTVNSNGNSLNWTSTKAIGAVLVGGSTSNRLYWMPEGMALGTQFSGTGFQNPNGSTITKVAFCYHEPATVTIIKEVQSQTGLSTVSFPFSTTNLGTSTMSLVDNNSVGPDRHVFSNLYKFAKWGDYNLTVTESVTQYWTLASLGCVETDTVLVPAQTQYATTVDFSTRKATIRLEEGENVTCTYKNASSNPTAAVGSISGRVTDSYGSGIAGARVTVVNGSSGSSNVVRTNSSGYYSFNDLPVAEFYLLTVEHKSYSFANNTRTFTLMEDLVGLDFVANP